MNQKDPSFIERTDATPLELLKQSLYLLAIWTPRWTTEMQQLKDKALAFEKVLSKTGQTLCQENLAIAELRSKAERYDRLKAIATRAANAGALGFSIGPDAYSSYEEAFDTVMAQLEVEYPEES